MNAPKIWKIIPALLVCGVVGMASAKLPAPPADPAKAAEAKKKADDTAKKSAEDLAKAQDRAVSNYKKQKGATTAKK